MYDNTLIYPGGAVKALGSGAIGGHLVLFGSADRTDVTEERDYFTADTDFWLGDSGEAKSVLLYNHGLDEEIGPLRLGDAELKLDKSGVWMQGQLKLRAAYEKKYAGHLEEVREAVKDGKMGLSSGSASHLVRREKQPNGAHKVTSWPIVEASLTPTPGEPRTRALAIKSLAEFKGEFLGPHAQTCAIAAALERLSEMTRMVVLERLRDEKATREEKLATGKGCLDEHAATAMRLIAALLDDPADSAAVKAILASFGSGAPPAPAPFLDSCLEAVSDLERAAAKFQKLGPAKRQAIKSLRDALDGLVRSGGPDPAEVAKARQKTDDLLKRFTA